MEQVSCASCLTIKGQVSCRSIKGQVSCRSRFAPSLVERAKAPSVASADEFFIKGLTPRHSRAKGLGA